MSDVVVVGSSDCDVVDDERGEILVLVGGVGDSYTVLKFICSVLFLLSH